MRFLLLGGTGQVGEEFRALSLPDDVEVVAPSRTALDLEDPRAIARMIAAERWSAVTMRRPIPTSIVPKARN